MSGETIEGLLRHLAPEALAAVVRRYGNFGSAEDAVQEALIQAATQWPEEGVPANPRAWLITVASRRLTDLLRSDQSRRRREERLASWTLPGDWQQPPADRDVSGDDTLILLFMCCHPSLSSSSQIALTLRAVGGLSTEEVARAFLVPVATMTRRITRAKQSIGEAGATFRMPSATEIGERLAAVLHALYLIFNEGYAATAGRRLYRVELSTEAIRLVRLVHASIPDDPETTGLLALMLLADARRPARATPDGAIVPLADQDRTLWNRSQIDEGLALVTAALSRRLPGPYQLQAAIAALHDEAASPEATDWPQILALYRRLADISDNPVVNLNLAVAVAHVEGPDAGLALVIELMEDRRLAGDHRLHSVRGHLLEMKDDLAPARAAYATAAEMATSLPHQRFLNSRVARLAGPAVDGDRHD